MILRVLYRISGSREFSYKPWTEHVYLMHPQVLPVLPDSTEEHWITKDTFRWKHPGTFNRVRLYA